VGFSGIMRLLKTFLVELRLFQIDVMLFKNSEAFLKHLKRNGGVLNDFEAF
jgi:hypothetical protein